MMRPLLFCVVVMLWPSVQQFAFGEEGILGQKPTFRAALLETLELRSQLHAGEFEYTMTFKMSDRELITWVQKGIYAYDDRVGTSLHVYINSTRYIDETIGIRTVVGGGVFTPPPEPSLYLHGERNSIMRAAELSHHDASQFRPFDFRALGLGFIGDFVRNTSFETVVTYHFSRAENVAIVDLDEVTKDPELRMTLKSTVSYNKGGVVFSISPGEDFWVLRHRHEVEGYLRNPDGTLRQLPRTLQTGADIELVEFEHRYLPSRVKVMDNTDTFNILLDWKKINPPVDEIDISFDRANDLVIEYRLLEQDPKFRSQLEKAGE